MILQIFCNMESNPLLTFVIFSLYLSCLNVCDMEENISLQNLVDFGIGKVKYPIPLSGGDVAVGDISPDSIINFNGDNSCIWVSDIETAKFFLRRGHHILKGPEIDKMRELYLKDLRLREKYPFWFD